MKSNNSGHSGRRSGRGSRRSSSRPRSAASVVPAPAAKTLWQKLIALITPAAKAPPASRPGLNAQRTAKPVRKPEAVEVTSEKLYVGNLSFEATENDLLELFSGVGSVRSAEIVTHKYNEKSKGFGFVLMTTMAEAQRAVAELHDKEFLGRKLVVSGAKSGEREPNYRG